MKALYMKKSWGLKSQKNNTRIKTQKNKEKKTIHYKLRFEGETKNNETFIKD
jgi:hypothetical protein